MVLMMMAVVQACEYYSYYNWFVVAVAVLDSRRTLERCH